MPFTANLLGIISFGLWMHVLVRWFSIKFTCQFTARKKQKDFARNLVSLDRILSLRFAAWGIGKMLLEQHDIAKMHNGLFRCPARFAAELMPEIAPVLETAPFDLSNHVLDVKVHMLIPGMYPAIPNWHHDLVPRTNGERDYSKVDPYETLWLWLSNGPLTEFADGSQPKPQEWFPFQHLTVHRATMATEHAWRLFIRAVPEDNYEPAPQEQWVRKQIQVYLDASKYTW